MSTYTDIISTDTWPAGLVGTLGVQILDADDVVIAAFSTAGISYVGSGIYKKTVTLNESWGPLQVKWSRDGGATYEAFETLPNVKPEATGSALAQELATALAGTTELVIHAAATGGVLDLFRGDSYLDAEETAIPITKGGNETHWPATLSTVHFSCKPTPELLELVTDAASMLDIECTVTTDSGDGQAFYLELTAEQTATLATHAQWPTGGYRFWFIANKDDEPKTLRSGPMTVHPNPAAA